MYTSSPKKYSADISEFIDQKNQQIQSLKNKILGSSVTVDEMQIAKSRLDDLRLTQIQLEKEDYLELKEVLKSSQNTVSELLKKRNVHLEKLEESKRDQHQMKELGLELEVKKSKMQKLLADIVQQGLKIKGKKEKKDSDILELEEDTSARRQQVAIQRQISIQLDSAKKQIVTKLKNAQNQLSETQTTNLSLREQIQQQLSKITQSQHEIEVTQLKCSILQEQISHSETTTTLHHHKIEYNQQFLHKFSEDKHILHSERETSKNISSLIQMCNQSHTSKVEQQKQCEESIKQITENMRVNMDKVKKLSGLAQTKKQTLKQLKEKGHELRSILNSIFKEDSSVLKLLADKKVYETDEKSQSGIEISLKNSGNFKADMLDAMETSQNFFLTNQASSN